MRVLTACLVFLAASVAIAQNGDLDGMKPTGIPHRIVLSPAVKGKIKLAFLAVLDIEPLASPDTYLNQTLDAKRAIRDARAMVESKQEKAIIADIEIIQIANDTCRSENSASDFKDCATVVDLWVDRVRVELGEPPVKRDEK